jgi:transcription initiation factor TFIIF subunit beta
MNAAYMRQMKERTRKYNTPQRQIGRIEDAGISGGRGGINMLSSGVGVGSGTAFNNLVVGFPICSFLFFSDAPV